MYFIYVSVQKISKLIKNNLLRLSAWYTQQSLELKTGLSVYGVELFICPKLGKNPS